MVQDRRQPESALSRPTTRDSATVVRVEAGGTISDMVNKVGGAPRLMTNIDVHSVDGRKMILHSTGNPDIDVDKLKGEAVAIQYWMAEVATVKNDDDGSLADVPRVVFFQPDGQFIAFTSWSVARFLDKLILVMGNGPYSPPIPVTFYRVGGKGGKSSYECTIVE